MAKQPPPTPPRSHRLTSLLALAALAAAGCPTTSAVGLQPSVVETTDRISGTVRVEATGSARRAGIGPRAISGDDLASALRATLLASGLCDGVVESGAADHLLRVEVVDLSTSPPKLDMEATMTARWTLLDGEGRIARWQDVVQSRGKATPYDSGLVEERSQMALEAAARANLEEGFARLCRAEAARE